MECWEIKAEMEMTGTTGTLKTSYECKKPVSEEVNFNQRKL